MIGWSAADNAEMEARKEKKFSWTDMHNHLPSFLM